jgi:hypothetical protein
VNKVLQHGAGIMEVYRVRGAMAEVDLGDEALFLPTLWVGAFGHPETGTAVAPSASEVPEGR